MFSNHRYFSLALKSWMKPVGYFAVFLLAHERKSTHGWEAMAEKEVLIL